MNDESDEVCLCLPPVLLQLLVMKAWGNNQCLSSEIVSRIKRSLELEANVVERSRSQMLLQRHLKIVGSQLKELGLSSEPRRGCTTNFQRE